METVIAFGLLFVTSMNVIYIFCIPENETRMFHKYSKHSENPDVYLTTPQIIVRHGYPVETYTIPTEDGFLLTLDRIPYSKYSANRKAGQPVFLQHGLLAMSSDWVFVGNSSLAFILSDAGYDVWIGNARGNSYSRGHMRYTPKDAEFWNFSWHEMGMYDLPAILSFVGGHTNQSGNIIYIGHSMGTTMFFVYASAHELAQKTVKMMVALAPVAFMTNVRMPFKYLAPWTDDIHWLLNHLRIYEYLPDNQIIKYLNYVMCKKNSVTMKLCEEALILLAGYSRNEFNADILPAVLSHEPAGTSTKTIVHYGQEIKSGGRFAKFDYGSAENMERYGTKIPPSYNVTAIAVPIFLMSSENDIFAGPQDVHKLSNILPKKIGDYVVPVKQFNHLDFIYGKHAPQFVYKPLLEVIRQYGTN